MGVERQKELSTGEVPQLETCVERGTNHVRHVENRKNGAVHERFGSKFEGGFENKTQARRG